VSYRIDNDQGLPQSRLAILSYAIAAIAILLLFGFWKLQLLDSSHYAELADRNRIRAIPIIAPRGRMLDRDGRVLLDNYPSFSVLLLRDSQTEVRRGLPLVADGMGIPVEDLEKQVEEAASLPRFQPIVIKPEASQADIAFIESHRADIPVLELLMVHRRHYPRDGFLANTIGYVGEVSPQDIEQSGGRLRAGDIVGKAGLERQYNDTLMGVDGMRQVIVNSIGREVGRLKQKEAVPGKPIQLTIDYDLQVVAEADMTGKKGAVVALDPRSGDVLAMVSKPSFDPNEFAIRISREQWEQLNVDPDRPLLNRAIQAQLAPGSVFKAVMATAMLESKAIPEDFHVFCTGSTEFYGRTFHCWEKRGHGEVDLHKGVVQSCDVFFYNVGKRLGIDRISYYAYQLGLGHRTGIDLPGEEPGLVPSEGWKERVFHQKWYPGETISVAIGQGATITTPLQLARMMGGIALGGVLKQPHMFMTNQPAPEVDFPLSQETTEKVTQALFGVVNEGGTASASRLQGIEFCGKTGSAQVISEQGLRRVGRGSHEFKDNAWFVGFAPRRNPEIVVAVLVQEGQHGASVAAPIARDIVKAYYDKKNGMLQKQTTAQSQPAGPAARPVVATIEPEAAAAGAHESAAGKDRHPQ
jgi:penicillin-binding protein 2